MNVVVVFKDKKHSSGCIRGDSIILYISSRLTRREQQRHIDQLTAKLLKKTSEITPDYLPSGIKTDADLLALAQEINEKHYRFPMAGIRFKKQESRWGSCSTKTRQIYISNKLVNAPRDLLKYLVAHELCHLGEPNHGKKFWALVARSCPDFKDRRKELKNFNKL